MKRYADEFESDFDEGPSVRKRDQRRIDDDLFKKPKPIIEYASRSALKKQFDDEHSRVHRQINRLMTLDAYSRHKEMINQYFLYYPGAANKFQRDTSNDRNAYDSLKRKHRFLWDEDELERLSKDSWEIRLVKRYYEKLFKEYCICDLSKFRKNKIAMRWRTEMEVRSGKGQFECGSKHCSGKDNLTSWEVNFAYIEENEKKNALVKLRLCIECSEKLNYGSKKKRYERRQRKSRIGIRETENDSEPASDTTRNLESKSSMIAEGRDDSKRINEEKQKEESQKMMEIWSKPQETEDVDKLLEEDLDDFLNTMFL